MIAQQDAVAAENKFFKALLEADGNTLEKLLADDFELIDVMRGSVVPKEALVGLVGSRQLIFESVDHVEAHPRAYGETVVITGRTRMGMRMGEMSGTVESRYTHVFARVGGEWKFVSAQGTQITE